MANLVCTTILIGGAEQCWLDDWGSPILEFWAYTLDAKTISHQTCMQACYAHSKDYSYFGLENSDTPECWCGKNPRLPNMQSTGCNAPCPGAPSEKCGGSGTLMSLYQFTCSDAPAPGGGPGPDPGPGPGPGPGPAPSGGGKSLHTGGIILIVVLVLIIVYIAGGIAFSVLYRKEPFSRDSLPNRSMWAGVGGSIADGGRFIWQSGMRAAGRGGSYTTM